MAGLEANIITTVTTHYTVLLTIPRLALGVSIYTKWLYTTFI